MVIRLKYNKLFINQLTELLTDYGKVDEIWLKILTELFATKPHRQSHGRR